MNKNRDKPLNNKMAIDWLGVPLPQGWGGFRQGER